MTAANGKPAEYEVLMFVVQPILARRNLDGEIAETLRCDAVEIGGVKLLAAYANRFKSELLPAFNHAQAAEAVAAALEPPPNRSQRRATRKRPAGKGPDA